MVTRQTARDYAFHVGCLLASVAVHLTVDRGAHFVSDLVPALTADVLLTFQIAGFTGVIVSLLAALAAPLNIVLSGYLIIRIAIELTAEFGWLFAVAFLPREQSDCRKRPLRRLAVLSHGRPTTNEQPERLELPTKNKQTYQSIF